MLTILLANLLLSFGQLRKRLFLEAKSTGSMKFAFEIVSLFGFVNIDLECRLWDHGLCKMWSMMILGLRERQNLHLIAHIDL